MNENSPKLRRTVAVFLFVGCLGACSGARIQQRPSYSEQPSDSEQSEVARLEKMERAIIELVGTAECSDPQDCRYIGFGAKPCGGAWRYLIYSATSVDTNQLRSLVLEYNTYNEELNARYGWMSDCNVPGPPRAGCRERRCVDLNEE